MRKEYFIFIIGCVLFSCTTNKAEFSDDNPNLIIITIDGLRWQEIFEGADSLLLYDDKFKKSQARRLTSKYWSENPEKRREVLMPFLWNIVAKNGNLYGNRNLGNKVTVRNPYNISYPGYSEIFTGYADTTINSNQMVLNPNTNFLEVINQHPEYNGKVAAFASWDRIHGYLNDDRNEFFINGGYNPVKGENLTLLQTTLNNLQSLYHGSESSRHDYITYLHAKQYLKLHKPKVLSIGFAWTDDMAHDGSYPQYLDKAHTFDNMIQDLWEYVQSQPEYKNNTTLAITVDHGRGLGEHWTSHGSKIEYSDEIWLAIMGPKIIPKGEISDDMEIFQDQIAATLSKLLSIDFEPEHPTGPYISHIITEN